MFLRNMGNWKRRQRGKFDDFFWWSFFPSEYILDINKTQLYFNACAHTHMCAFNQESSFSEIVFKTKSINVQKVRRREIVSSPWIGRNIKSLILENALTSF